MSIIRKETNMIKATISNETKRNAFAKAGGRKIAGGICVSKAAVRGLVISKKKSLKHKNLFSKYARARLTGLFLCFFIFTAF